MNFDIDNLISTFKKFTSSKIEVGEQEAETSGTDSATKGSTTVPIWADVVGGPTRGRANMLGKEGEKWESGAKRGVANQIY